MSQGGRFIIQRHVWTCGRSGGRPLWNLLWLLVLHSKCFYWVWQIITLYSMGEIFLIVTERLCGCVFTISQEKENTQAADSSSYFGGPRQRTISNKTGLLKMWKKGCVPLCRWEVSLVFRVLARRFVDFSSLLCHKCFDRRIQFSCLNLDTCLPLQCASISCLVFRRPCISLRSCVPPPALYMSCLPQVILDGTESLCLGIWIMPSISLLQLLISMVEIRFLSFSHRDSMKISA